MARELIKNLILSQIEAKGVALVDDIANISALPKTEIYKLARELGLKVGYVKIGSKTYEIVTDDFFELRLKGLYIPKPKIDVDEVKKDLLKFLEYGHLPRTLLQYMLLNGKGSVDDVIEEFSDYTYFEETFYMVPYKASIIYEVYKGSVVGGAERIFNELGIDLNKYRLVFSNVWSYKLFKFSAPAPKDSKFVFPLTLCVSQQTTSLRKVSVTGSYAKFFAHVLNVKSIRVKAFRVGNVVLLKVTPLT